MWRIQKSSASGTTNYVYDGDSIIEELDANGNSVARYAQGLGIDEPLAMLRSGATSYYEADGLGSITSLTDSTGNAAERYGYDSFGNGVYQSGNVTNPFQFTARERDSETALYYYRARYYDPTEGRFLNEDPIGFQGGINFFAYVGNNPTDFVDPTGYAPCLNIDGFAQWLDDHAHKKSQHYCARAVRQARESSASGTTNYAYDGDSITEELDANGNSVARYAQGLGIDEPLAMLRSGATDYYEADGLGSITSLTDTTGNAAERYGYDSFGNQPYQSGNLTNPFQFTAREFDSETALYYYRARYYDPMVGRFLNEDPIRLRLRSADIPQFFLSGTSHLASWRLALRVAIHFKFR